MVSWLEATPQCVHMVKPTTILAKKAQKHFSTEPEKTNYPKNKHIQTT